MSSMGSLEWFLYKLLSKTVVQLQIPLANNNWTTHIYITRRKINNSKMLLFLCRPMGLSYKPRWTLRIATIGILQVEK